MKIYLLPLAICFFLLSCEKKNEAFSYAMKLRKEGNTVLVEKMNKNKKFQKERLSEQGYSEFKEYFSKEFK